MLHDNQVLAGLRESKFCLDLTSLSCSPQAHQFGEHQGLLLDLLFSESMVILRPYRALHINTTTRPKLQFYISTCMSQVHFRIYSPELYFKNTTGLLSLPWRNYKVFALPRPLPLFLDCSAFPAPVVLCLVILTEGQETKTMLSLTTFLKSLFPFAVFLTEIFFPPS